MAEYSQDDHKAELIAEIDRARAQFSRNLSGLRHDIDIGAHVKNSFTSHKAAWLGSAGIAGWVLSRLPSRRKKVVVKARDEHRLLDVAGTGVVLTILKLLFNVFRPAITAFAARKITDFAAKNNRWQK